MDKFAVPPAFSPLDQTQLPVGIPAAVADPPLAVVTKAFHPVAIVRKAAFFLLRDTVFELVAEVFVGVEEKQVVMGGHPGGGVLLIAIA